MQILTGNPGLSIVWVFLPNILWRFAGCETWGQSYPKGGWERAAGVATEVCYWQFSS